MHEPFARAQLAACTSGLAPADRAATFLGTMRSRRKGDRLEMRFELQRRIAPGFFRRLPAPGLGTWLRADRGVERYRYRQKVENLPAPGVYRGLVSFRWSGPNGGAFARAQHTTAPCRQPDLRPNVRPVALQVLALAGGQARYAVTVRNFGPTPARDFDVLLSVDAATLPKMTVSGLGAYKSVVVHVDGARCQPGGRLLVVVDPDNRVGESREVSRQLTAACPLS